MYSKKKCPALYAMLKIETNSMYLVIWLLGIPQTAEKMSTYFSLSKCQHCNSGNLAVIFKAMISE